jgi:peptidoglycan/xylan/chitin deacetylase (PgdA/CDA1 family)
MLIFLIKLMKYVLVPIGVVYSLFKKKCVKILMYHRVNDAVHKELSVTQADFLWQMEYLKKKGWEVISLDEAVYRMKSGSIHKRNRLVVLTFDDGYEDFYINAFPVLSRYGYAAISYLVPGYIDSGDVFWWDGDLGESKLMSWEQIKVLKKSELIQFGSHTMRHIDLNLLDRWEVVEELRKSKEILQQRLAQEVRHFSYPRGIATKLSRDVAFTLYDTAVSIFNGDEILCGFDADLLQLKRLPVQRSDGRNLFVARLNGWLNPEEWLRRLVGRLTPPGDNEYY